MASSKRFSKIWTEDPGSAGATQGALSPSGLVSPTVEFDPASVLLPEQREVVHLAGYSQNMAKFIPETDLARDRKLLEVA